MGDNLFSDDGHVHSWIFFPPAWGGEQRSDWRSGFSEDQLGKIYSHMKQCLLCRKTEVNMTLKWIEFYSQNIDASTRIQIADTRGTTKLPDKAIMSIIRRIEHRCKRVLADYQELKRVIKESKL